MIGLTIEEAKDEGGEIIGFRLSVGDQSLLVFSDQQGMPGFRHGEKFIPSYGQEITYTVVFTGSVVQP